MVDEGAAAGHAVDLADLDLEALLARRRRRRTVAAGNVNKDFGRFAGGDVAIVRQSRVVRRHVDDGAAAGSGDHDIRLVCDKCRRGKRRLVDLGGDNDVDIAAIDLTRAVEIAGRQTEVLKLYRVVGVGSGRDRCRGKRPADGVRAVAGHLDVDDLEAGRQCVDEIQPDVLQIGREGRIGEFRRVAPGAEAQPVADIVAVELCADLLEEGLRLAAVWAVGIAARAATTLEVEAGHEVGRWLRRCRCTLHGGEREPGRHQPARGAPGK